MSRDHLAPPPARGRSSPRVEQQKKPERRMTFSGPLKLVRPQILVSQGKKRGGSQGADPGRVVSQGLGAAPSSTPPPPPPLPARDYLVKYRRRFFTDARQIFFFCQGFIHPRGSRVVILVGESKGSSRSQHGYVCTSVFKGEPLASDRALSHKSLSHLSLHLRRLDPAPPSFLQARQKQCVRLPRRARFSS